MRRIASIACVFFVIAGVGGTYAAAAPKKGKAAKKEKEKVKEASEQTRKAIGELAGRYKWGMSPQEVIDLIAGDIKKAYEEKIKKASSPLDQDRLRAEMGNEIQKVKDSYVRFDGQRTSWDISIVDREFAHRNGESMLVYWEPTQRRFLFFYQDKLWKQFIALNAELFEGKTFNEFADMVAARYGEPKRVTSVDSRGREVLDHLEWPPAGDFLLRAVDHTNLYGNYCLVLAQKSVLDIIEKRRAENNPDSGRKSGVDQFFKGKAGDLRDTNADVVDQITGRQFSKPKLAEEEESPKAGQGTGAVPGEEGAAKKAPPKKKGKAKKK